MKCGLRNLVVYTAILLTGGAIDATNAERAGDQRMPTTQGATLNLDAMRFVVGEWTLETKWANGNPLKARSAFAYETAETAISGRTFVIDESGGESQRDLTVFAMTDGMLSQFVFHHDGSARMTHARASEGKAIVFEWIKPGAAGKADVPLRQVWTPIDAVHFRWQSFMQIKGEWHTTIDGTWTRKAV